MSLVGDLITETVDASSDLSQVLRKAKVLASELSSEELGAWVDAELGGYKPDDLLRDYRVFVATNLGSFISATWEGPGLPIPLSSLPNAWRQPLSNVELRQGIAALREMHDSETEYVEQWPADAVAAVAGKIYEGANMYRAWKALPKARLAGVLDSVRNRLLNFLLGLKERHPEVETPEADLHAIPHDEVRVNVVNHIFGGTNVFASGGTIHQQVQQGADSETMATLLEALRAATIPEDLLRELQAAIEEDEPERGDGLGPRVSRWLARVGAKAASGTTAAIATQALLQYYGLAGA